MALDTTLHGETADSYVTLAEADAYFADHYVLAKSTAWSTFSDAQKEMLLKRSCQVIETLPLEDTVYWRRDSTQALTFPRNADYHEDGSYYVRQEVMDAQCEQAIYLSTLDEGALADQIQGVKYQEVGAGGGIIFQATYKGLGSVVAPMALALMGPLLRRSSRLLRA